MLPRQTERVGEQVGSDTLPQKMNLQKCREFLGWIGMGRLGCSRENQPYVIAIYFACEGTPAVSRTFGRQRQHSEYVSLALRLWGQKIEWMRADPPMCVEVDEVFASNNWRSVVVTGRFEELTDKPELDEVRRQAQETWKGGQSGGRRLRGVATTARSETGAAGLLLHPHRRSIWQ